jgi:hypothetical protein
MVTIYRYHAWGTGDHPPPPMEIMEVDTIEEAEEICHKLNVSLHGEGFKYTSWDNPRFDIRRTHSPK